MARPPLPATPSLTPFGGFEGQRRLSPTVQDGQFSAAGLIRIEVAKLAHLSVNKTLVLGAWRGQDLPDVPQGSIVTYELSLINGADGEIASNAVLTDVIPGGVQFTQWITQSGATLNGNTIQWNAGALPKNSVATISFRATVIAAPGSVIPNTARATAANAIPSLATATVTVGNGFKVVMPQVLK
ncbi:MAG: DUF11 domain-containing protein [Anaerolineales bacterium]|nr:DUF11 domain-containing protein [Anaerolineales bacterium]